MSGSSPPSAAPRCASHGEAPVYRCDGCGELLCEECVKEGPHLTLCGLCGELALPLGEERAAIPELPEEPEPPADESPTPESSYAPEPTYTPEFVPATPEPTSLAVHLANHVVVPAATIAMVVAFLFYLLDVRSVFLGDARALQWLGFWFVVAAVLIARYGKASGDADRQGCYTFALAAAMVLVMALSPWEHPRARVTGPIANSAIILVVWRFATHLTRGLSLEGHQGRRRSKLRLFGLERLRFEAWQRQEGRAPEPSGPKSPAGGSRVGKTDDHGSPSAAVARLVMVALVVFAVGEPILLAGPPEVGVGAFAAMIVFLLAAGVVLAAGSAVGTLRHAHAIGGQISERVVPARIAMAATLMAVILAVALAVPGIQYQGSGRLQPAKGRGVTDSSAAGEDGDRAAASEAEPEEPPICPPPGEPADGRPRASRDRRRASAQSEPESADRDSSAAQSSAGSLAASFLSLGGALGKLLWFPFALSVAIAAGVFLWRLWPHLASRRRRLGDRWRAFLARLAAGLRGLVGRRRAVRARPPQVDPLRDYQSLLRLSPRDSVVAAYARLLTLFDQLGYQRQERHTPYEILNSLPAQLRHLSTAATKLTALYVKAVYSTEAPDSQDRDTAVATLGKLKGLVAEIGEAGTMR
ncbi:MAG: DUF4129 domain-containing protein [bacterium]|nr:DUF4129 domain-containing protein [bacterium]